MGFWTRTASSKTVSGLSCFLQQACAINSTKTKHHQGVPEREFGSGAGYRVSWMRIPSERSLIDVFRTSARPLGKTGSVGFLQQGPRTSRWVLPPYDGTLRRPSGCS